MAHLHAPHLGRANLKLAFGGAGWLGTLSQFLGLASLLGIINGALVDGFFRWIGHPRDPQPLWFTILCAVVFLVVVALDLISLSEHKES
jgi:hypothetical protein